MPSGHDPADYVTRRLMAPSHDGELVPTSRLHRRDTPLDGGAPCLLHGYGAYGITTPAGFGAERLSLVDRGFVYAIAHVRRGEDKGWDWYENGKRDKKPNTFHDFIAAGRHLVKEGFTRHDRLVAHGGSAGGLLMGAAANMAPEDYAAVVAEVPFVDALNTMLDDSLPLTPVEWPEWGSPIVSEVDHRTIAAYSPYDNAGPRPYPAGLALAGCSGWTSEAAAVDVGPTVAATMPQATREARSHSTDAEKDARRLMTPRTASPSTRTPGRGRPAVMAASGGARTA